MEREQELCVAVINEVKKAVTGKDDCIRKVCAAILAGGHILLEDVPGVGKTTLAMAFSNALSLKNNRVQFTPDVLPADILGFNMYKKKTDTFEYHPGTIMCNLFLADEINRTSPKTQSALLEVMEEGKVTVDGVTREVPKPFVVIATENPKGSAGTQLLPESQLDRFMICLSIGYPDMTAEIMIAIGKSMANASDVSPVVTAMELEAIKGKVEEVFVDKSLFVYITKLIRATRENPYIELGVSPRGTICLVKMAKAWAYLHGRSYVIPKDVEEVFMDVCKHRIVLNTKARVARVTAESLLGDILSTTKQPASYKRKDN